MAIGGHLNQIFDLTVQQRPVHTAAMQKELNRDTSSGIQITPRPDLSKRPGSEKLLKLVSWDFCRRSGSLQRQLLAGRFRALRLILRQILVIH